MLRECPTQGPHHRCARNSDLNRHPDYWTQTDATWLDPQSSLVVPSSNPTEQAASVPDLGRQQRSVEENTVRPQWARLL